MNMAIITLMMLLWHTTIAHTVYKESVHSTPDRAMLLDSMLLLRCTYHIGVADDPAVTRPIISSSTVYCIVVNAQHAMWFIVSVLYHLLATCYSYDFGRILQ